MFNEWLVVMNDKCMYSCMRQIRGLGSKHDEWKMIEAVRSQPEYIH